MDVTTYDPLQDAGLLQERLTRAGLEIATCEFTAEGQPSVTLARPTKLRPAKLAELLLKHDAAAVAAIQAELDLDKPITRREVREMFAALRAELLQE